MQEGHNNIKDRVGALLGWAITLLAWTVAVALAYSVYVKFKLLFH